MVVVGGIIGAGIFLSPPIVAQRAGTPGLILSAWVLGGAIALAGALCFAELGTRRPEAGGGYVYLRETFGAAPAFLYGWTQLFVINTGGIAAVAITFARYLLATLEVESPAATRAVAVGAIVLLSGINYFGIRAGSITQNIFTVLKLAALAVLIGAGVWWWAGGGAPLDAASAAGAAEAGAGPLALAAILGVSIIPILFSYGGWQHANHIAAEVRAPRRTLPRALLLGVALVVAVYVLANAAYLWTLGAAGLAASAAPAADALQRVVPWGRYFIAAGIAASTFGALNLYVLAGPRIYQAMADDGLFFRRLARLHPRWRTPSGALALQCAWAVLLALSGTYAQLLDYVVFGDWIFFGLVVATIFAYRRKAASAGRARGDVAATHDAGAFTTPGHPLVPLLFIAAAALVVLSSVLSNPRNALIGAALILAGLPVFWVWSRRKAGRAGP